MPTIRSALLTRRVGASGVAADADVPALAQYLNRLGQLYGTGAFRVVTATTYNSQVRRAVAALKAFTAPGLGTVTPADDRWTDNTRLKMVEMFRLKGYAVVAPGSSSAPAPSPAAGTAPTGNPGGRGAGVFASTTTIRRGMCGELVGAWVELLNWTRPRHGSAFLTETRTFSSAVEAATKRYQRFLGFTGRDVDGVVGPDTRAAARRHVEREGYAVRPGRALAATSCTPAAPTSPAASGSGADLPATSADTGAGAAPGAGGAVGGVLDFFGAYGPVLAVGLGVAAFAMLSTPPSRRR